MAFNPFSTFRKHKKVLFATLTIIVMFTFVLSSGLPGNLDLMNLLPQSISGRKTVVPVATLYGKKITYEELDKVRNQRRLAATALGMANFSAQVNQPFQNPDKDRDAFLAHQMRVRQAEFRLQNWFAEMGTLDDTLDFLIWKHQADELGIQLTKDDIDREFRDMTAADDMDVAKIMAPLLRQYQRLKPETVYAALGDEFRVRLAKTALMGEEAAFQFTNTMLRKTPAWATPYEFWKYYLDQLTTLEVALLPVRVEDFRGKVEAPTAKQLEDLFEKWKAVEAAPDRKEPGFHEPRRVQIEWVTARPDSKVFQELAPQREVLNRLFWTTGATAPAGGAFAGTALNLALPLTFDVQFLSEYEKYRLGEINRHQRSRLVDIFTTGFSLRDANLVRPDVLAATVGQVLASSATLGSVFEAPVTLQANAISRQMFDDARLAARAVLAASGVDPLQAVGFTATLTPEALPLEQMRGPLAEKVRERQARVVLMGVLQDLDQKLTANKLKPEEARKAIDEAVKAYGLAHGATAKPLNKYDLDTDPELKPLRDLHAHDHRDERTRDAFFRDLFFPSTTLRAASPGLYDARRLPTFATADQPFEEQSLYWHKAEQPEREPRFEDVKDKVREAWILQRARRHAEDAVLELKDAVKATQGDLAQLRDLSAQRKADLIEPRTLGAISRQKRSDLTLTAGTARDYKEYEFPPVIKYPRVLDRRLPLPQKTWLDQLLTDLKQPGDVTVLKDRPEKTFYVAVLLSRNEPPLSDFYKAYQEASRGGIKDRHDPLFTNFLYERRQEFRQALLKQLREEAGAADDRGQYKVDDEMRLAFLRRTGGGDE